MYVIPINHNESFDRAWQKFIEKTGYAVKFWKKNSRTPRKGKNKNNIRRKKEQAMRRISFEKKLAEQLTTF
jgi:hypothetical protein